MERPPPGDELGPGFDEWLRQVDQDMQDAVRKAVDTDAALADVKRLAEQGGLRPRFGVLVRRDGSETPVVFHPGPQQGTFVALHAGDETPLLLRPGDELRMGPAAPGQRIHFQATLPVPCGRCWRCRWRRLRPVLFSMVVSAAVALAVYMTLLVAFGVAAQAAGVPPHPAAVLLYAVPAVAGAVYVSFRLRDPVYRLSVWLLDSPDPSSYRLAGWLRRWWRRRP